MARYNNKRKQSLMMCMVCLMLFIFGVTAGISYAYFSDSKTASNTLNFGKLIISTKGETTTTITLTPNQKNGMTENDVYKIAVNDTVSIAGSIGLEENSVPAYIRMKVDMADQNSNKITGEFKTGFMAQMAEMIDTTNKQWFVVGNYLYLGNEINADNPFVFSDSNTNTSGATAVNNKIKMTNEMLTNEIAGNQITITFTLQAIQVAGMTRADGTTAVGTLTGYTEGNAEIIAGIPVWKEIFGVDLNEFYSETWTYTRGTFSQTMTANAQMASYGTFEEDNSGEFIQFGWYPQTIKASSVTITTTKKFAGWDCYVGSDEYLYVKVASPTPYNSGNRLLYSVKELTSMVYFERASSGATRTIQGESSGIYDNNYKYSYVRAYLNGLDTYGTSGTVNANTSKYYYKDKGLLQQAFTTAQSNLIKSTTVDNSASTTGNSSNSYVCENTEDKIFLLSYKDLNSTYSSAVKNGSSSATRMKFPTDYAGAMGAKRNNSTSTLYGGSYWMRSPYSSSPDDAWYVFGFSTTSNYDVNASDFGVVPALFL